MANYLITIVGPTAIGKTDLAIHLAKEFHTGILSADSRQFYREMSIGTAKPSEEVLNQVTHYFINSLHIQDEYTVGDYENDAITILKEIYKEKNSAILVGGSGLYVNAVTQGFDNLPKADAAIREDLNTILKEKGIYPLQEQLKELDPEYYQQVDRNNPQRVIRALEVMLATGKPFSSYRLNIEKPRPFKTIKIGLNTNREVLYKRINNRVDEMISAGLIDEVKRLLPYQHLNALQTVGYAELFDYLNGKTSLAEATEKIKQNTRRFAKRQLTWFRKDSDIKWFEPKQEMQIINYLHEKMRLPD